jgi:hypothetical protein
VAFVFYILRSYNTLPRLPLPPCLLDVIYVCCCFRNLVVFSFFLPIVNISTCPRHTRVFSVPLALAACSGRPHATLHPFGCCLVHRVTDVGRGYLRTGSPSDGITYRAAYAAPDTGTAHSGFSDTVAAHSGSYTPNFLRAGGYRNGRIQWWKCANQHRQLRECQDLFRRLRFGRNRN